MELIVCDEKENWLAHNSPSGKGTGRETLSSSPHNPNAASAQSVNGRQGLLVQSLAACMPHKHDDDDEIFFGEVRTVERTKQARLKTHDSPSGKGTGRAQTLSSSPHNPNAAVLASVQSVENHQGLLAQSFAVCMPHKHEDDDEIFFGKVRTIERTKQSRLKTHALSPNVPAKPKFANDDRTVAGGHPEEDDEVEVFFGPRTELERSLHHVISRKRRRTMLLPRRGQFPDTEDRIAAAIIIQSAWRRQFQRRRGAAIALQRRLRGRRARLAWFRMRQVIVSVQAAVRGRQQRNHFCRLRRATVVIQQCWRRYARRQTAKRAAMTEMSALRAQELAQKMTETSADKSVAHALEAPSLVADFIEESQSARVPSLSTPADDVAGGHLAYLQERLRRLREMKAQVLQRPATLLDGGSNPWLNRSQTQLDDTTISHMNWQADRDIIERLTAAETNKKRNGLAQARVIRPVMDTFGYVFLSDDDHRTLQAAGAQPPEHTRARKPKIKWRQSLACCLSRESTPDLLRPAERSILRRRSAHEKFPFEGEHVPAVLVLRKIPMADGQFRLLQFDVSSTSLKVVEPHGETSETNETTSL